MNTSAVFILRVFIAILVVVPARGSCADQNMAGSTSSAPSVSDATRIKTGDTKYRVQTVLGEPKQFIKCGDELTQFYERCTVVFQNEKVTTVTIFSDEQIERKKQERQFAEDRATFQRKLDEIEAEAKTKQRKQEEEQRWREFEKQKASDREAERQRRELVQQQIESKRQAEEEMRRNDAITQAKLVELLLREKRQPKAARQLANDEIRQQQFARQRKGADRATLPQMLPKIEAQSGSHSVSGSFVSLLLGLVNATMPFVRTAWWRPRPRGRPPNLPTVYRTAAGLSRQNPSAASPTRRLAGALRTVRTRLACRRFPRGYSMRNCFDVAPSVSARESAAA